VGMGVVGARVDVHMCVHMHVWWSPLLQSGGVL